MLACLSVPPSVLDSISFLKVPKATRLNSLYRLVFATIAFLSFTPPTIEDILPPSFLTVQWQLPPRLDRECAGAVPECFLSFICLCVL